jgi:hypothetical protein
VRKSGGYCFPSAERAVLALDRLHRRAQWLDSMGIDAPN